MKLQNKKTGTIVNVLLNPVFTEFNKDGTVKNTVVFDSLAELNEEWEDYEEMKEYYWFIDDAGVVSIDKVLCSEINMRKSIGNYFETKEEAELAVEKLKAWKRLKDKGFKLDAVVDSFFCLDIYMKGEPYEEIKEDLKIVFGGNK